MTERDSAPPTQFDIVIRHASNPGQLAACFPVISQLRPKLKDVSEWIDRASEMTTAGYRVLAAWDQERVLAVAGYRVVENLIHGRFLYVDDLVSLEDQRGKGLGAALLKELSVIGADMACLRLVLDTAMTNTNARRFYAREGLIDSSVGFYKPLEKAT